MNTQTILSLVTIIAVTFSPCCRQKSSGEIGSKVSVGSKDEEITKQKNIKIEVESEVIEKHLNSNILADQRISYQNFEKQMIAIHKSAGWPRNEEQESSFRESLHALLEHRKRLLFSVPISPEAEIERNDAWNFLAFRPKLAIFTSDQNDYAKILLNSYLSAPNIEKLVIWDLIRMRLDSSFAPGGGRGLSGTSEMLLRRELAKLLFSALGMQKQELFDAVDLKTRYANSENGAKAELAEEEIERLHTEQSKVAEQILEKHWKLPP